MVSRLLVGFCLLSLSAALAADPGQLGTISILAGNNLDLTDADPASAALLLRQPYDLGSATEACTSLGETLWSPADGAFYNGLNQSLAYEVFAGRMSRCQLLWVQQPSAGEKCQAVRVDGTMHDTDCRQKLPVLCSQSAPPSTKTYADTSARFQITQKVNDQTLTGYRDFYTFRYLGVRFAEEPERFTYSTPYRAVGANMALDPAPACLQLPPSGSSTDCLFLNVWTTTAPNGQERDLRPVMVYIYGGGFTTGSASNPNQDGSYLASRGDVVVVAIAYRLSTLGFLPFEDGVHNGNYYISDQIAGLQWIQENIRSFGGDPNHVTIFGESAGAVSVQNLIESPEAAGLFHAVIAQSNYDQRSAAIPQAYNSTTVHILQQTGCDQAADPLACLQSYDPVQLLSLKTISNAPVVDGKYLKTPFLNFSDTAPRPKPNSVPLMIGVNRDEGGVLAPFFQTDDLDTGIRDIAATLGTTVQAILSSGLFPLGSGPVPSNQTLDVFNTTTRIYTDYSFKCSSQAIALGGVVSGDLPKVWFYEFNRTYQDPSYDTYGVCQPPKTTQHPNGDPSQEYFKCHAGDLFFTFGTVVRSGLPLRDENDNPYQQLLTDYWTSFGRTFDPNPDPNFLRARGYWNTLEQVAVAGPWSQVDEQNPQLMQLQWNPFMRSFVDEPQCAVLGLPVNYLLG